MAFSRSILRMSSCTAASSLWLMVEDVVGGATARRAALSGLYAKEADEGVSGDWEGECMLLLLVWMLLDDA
jgi:hypothetical protein